MTSILDHYKVLGVAFGAGLADVTSSYRRLCRAYHPDVSDDPESEEQMKRINIAYAVLREKLTREAYFRERQQYSRPVRRYPGQEARARAADAHRAGADQQQRGASRTRADGASQSQQGAQQQPPPQQQQPGAQQPGTDRASQSQTQQGAPQPRYQSPAGEREACSVLEAYFRAISVCDYAGAYNCLSAYDKRYVTRDSFIQWRKSVARLYPIREFQVEGGLPAATVSFKDGRSMYARRFTVAVTEENFTEGKLQSGDVEKLVVFDRGSWYVFLGYKGVSELTRSFDERFDAKRKRDIARRMEDYYSGLSQEFDMLGPAGLRKAASREIYRQKRFGGTLSFAAISIKAGGAGETGLEELIRSAAGTITGALRETDSPAYAGDGVFAILFVELKKKNIGEITARLVQNIRKNAGPQLGGRADIEYAYDSWSGGNPANIVEINNVLRKFHKKL